MATKAQMSPSWYLVCRSLGYFIPQAIRYYYTSVTSADTGDSNKIGFNRDALKSWKCLHPKKDGKARNEHNQNR